jgi:hypothetical protein
VLWISTYESLLITQEARVWPGQNHRVGAAGLIVRPEGATPRRRDLHDWWMTDDWTSRRRRSARGPEPCRACRPVGLDHALRVGKEPVGVEQDLG